MFLLFVIAFAQNCSERFINYFIYIRGIVQKEKGEPFRECFGRLSEIRALMKSGLPVIGLTATADINYQQLIKTTLKMSPSLCVVSAAIDKRNIRFSFNKVNLGRLCHIKLDFVFEGVYFLLHTFFFKLVVVFFHITVVIVYS